MTISIHSRARLSDALLPWLTALGLAIGFAALLLAAPAHGKAEQAGADGLIPDTPPARIEVAFVLDTTGSMTGLIEGAKRKIWSIANNLIDLEPKPEIRFALIGYRDRGDAYVTKRFDLTNDVQLIYGELLAFHAAGGGDTPESVNQALDEAVTRLDWSTEDSVFRVIFLVGDAPPHMDYQDDVTYAETVGAARQRDIIVNAVQAGSVQSTTPVWREIATLGGGEFARIAQDGAMTHLETPYDAQIQTLRRRISETVIYYGAETEQSVARSKVENALSAGGAVSSDMAGYLAKSGGGVITGGGDLVQDVVEGRVDLDDLAAEALPEPMQQMSETERKAFLDGRAAERRAIQHEIDALVAERDAYLGARRAEMAAHDAFDLEVERMISEQSAAKGFRATSD